MDSAYRETSKYLLKVVHTKYNLMEHMKVREEGGKGLMEARERRNL